MTDHGITIDVIELPAGQPLRASCLCGWLSPVVPSRPRASAHGEAHLIGVAVEHAQAVRESIEDRAGSGDHLRASSKMVPCDLLPVAGKKVRDAIAEAIASVTAEVELDEILRRDTEGVQDLHTHVDGISTADPIRDDLGSTDPIDYWPTLTFEFGELDPLIDECPPWCEAVTRGLAHTVEGRDVERTHHGATHQVVVRSETAKFHPPTGDEGASYTLAALEIYLRRNVIEAAPQVHIGLYGESSKTLNLTLGEADKLARLLLSLVEVAG